MDVADERHFALSPLAKQLLVGSSEEGCIAGRHKEMCCFKSKSCAVQGPACEPNWHIPATPGSHFDRATQRAAPVLNGVSAHALSLSHESMFQQEALTNEDDYFHWIIALWGSHSECAIMSALCHESSRP